MSFISVTTMTHHYLEESLQNFRQRLNDIFSDLSEAIVCDASEEVNIFEDALNSALILEEQIEQAIDLDFSDHTEGSLELTALHGVALLCIARLQQDIGSVNYYPSLVKLIEVIEQWNQTKKCIWLYSQAMYYRGLVMEGENAELALATFVHIEENIQEYLLTNLAFDDIPDELVDILQNPDHQFIEVFFHEFFRLRGKVQIKILEMAQITENEDILFKYGVDGILAAFYENFHLHPDRFSRFFHHIECVADVFMCRMYFKQACHLISFYRYLIETHNVQELIIPEGIIGYEISHAELILSYADQFLDVLIEYRNNQLAFLSKRKVHELVTVDDLDECQFVLPEDKIKKYDAHVPYSLDCDDESIKVLIATARSLIEFLKTDADDPDNWNDTDENFEKYERALFKVPEDGRNSEITSNLGTYRDQINAVKFKFRRLSDNNFGVVHDYQKFCWLATIEDEARMILKSTSEEHVLYEEVATLACAIGIVLVKEFHLDNGHSSKIQLILDHCESLAESLRLLPSGLVLYMSTQYFQAKIILRMEAPSKVHLQTAVKMLIDAKIAYEEYQCVNTDVKPKDLHQILQFPNHDQTPFKLFEPIEVKNLVQQIHLAMFKVAIQLHDFDLIQIVGIAGIKSAHNLYNNDKLGPSAFIKVLIALSYEFLEQGYIPQVNHLIATATVVLRGIVKNLLKTKESLDLLRLCYYHTLICQSISLIHHPTEHKSKKQKCEKDHIDRVTDNYVVIQEESLYPGEVTTNIDEINSIFKKARELIQNFNHRTPSNVVNIALSSKEEENPTLVNDIKVHLDEKYEALNAGPAFRA